MAPSRGHDEPTDTIQLTRALTAQDEAENPPPAAGDQANPDRNRLFARTNLSRVPSRDSSIRIRRLSTNTQQRPQAAATRPETTHDGRTSENLQTNSDLGVPGTTLSREKTAAGVMPPVREESLDVPSSDRRPVASDLPSVPEQARLPLAQPTRTEPGSVRRRGRSVFGRQRGQVPPGAFSTSREYGSNAIDLLDVVGTYQS